jgi:hypothetical protein
VAAVPWVRSAVSGPGTVHTARMRAFMVWPLPGQLSSAVSASYRAAAEASDALLLPAGDAWAEAACRAAGGAGR